jgi:cytoskeletal protein CcmA (bactofilin family)
MPPPNRPPASPRPILSELAEQFFAPFSRAEGELFRVAQKGGEASALAKNEHENDPAKAAKWNADRVVRAECIAWVCTDPQASTLVSYQGLDLRGMRIDGDLDLSKAKIEFFLSAQKCAFSGSILLRDTEVRGLYFSTCHVKSPNPDREEFKAFDAEGARIWGCLYLRDSCRVEGEVSLIGATIGRDLDCSEAQFSNSGSDVFTADGAKIEGDVLFNGCKAKGIVRLLGARIGGDLDCDGAQFSNPKADALIVDGMRIQGDVRLGGDFKADGVVSLSGTKIGGNLDCSGAQFLNPEDEAIRAEGATIEGDVLFKNDFDDDGEVKSNFNAEGGVELKGATIGGDFDCEHAQFSNPEDDAITADVLTVKGDVTFGKGFKADGKVRLFGAMIGGDLECEGAQFINPEGALNSDAAKIGGDVKFHGGVKAIGRVGFSGATIGGDLDCEFTKLSIGEEADTSEENGEEDDDDVLNADGAKIGGSIFFRDGFKAEGEVSLIGATIGGDIDLGSAEFVTPGNDAISADRAKIGGDVMFDDGCTAAGAVRFLGAMIGGDLECDDAVFSNPGDDAFNAVGAKIEGSIAFRDKLDVKGCVNLSNTEVSRALELQGFTLSAKATLDLRSAKVGTIRDDRARWKRTANLLLDGFSYERFQVEGTLKAADWITRCHRQGRERQKPLLHRATKQILAVLLRTEQWLMSAAVRKKCLRRKERVRQKQFRPQPYEQLAAVLRKMGHEREARRLMIAKNRDRARSTRFLHQGWWWYNFFGRFIGYGYAPWRAFAISLALILIGFGLFQSGYRHGLVLPAKEGAYVKNSDKGIEIPMDGRKVSKDYPAFNAFVYSLESFTPLLKLDQTANWAPNTNSPPLVSIGSFSVHAGGLLRSYLYCHIVAGWLLTSLWVGAVTGLVKS